MMVNTAVSASVILINFLVILEFVWLAHGLFVGIVAVCAHANYPK